VTEDVQDRLRHGREHEIAVREKLAGHGWAVQDWGQGLLDDKIRVPLRHARRELAVLWRWIPDLIAVKYRSDRWIITLVDPKTDLRTDTANFSIELSAWQAHLAMLPLGLPIVYVWSDFTCNTAERLDPVRVLPGVDHGRTSFMLVRKADQKPFEWAFGPAATGQVAS
jgi:hypothetical protein